MLRRIGLRPAGGWAWISALVETLGGLSLALGLLTPLAAGMLIANLLMAIITVDWKNGFRNADRGFKIPSHWSAGLLRSGWSGLEFTQSV